MEFQTYLNTIKDLIFDYSPKVAVALLILFGGLWLTSFITKTAKKLMTKRNVEITLTNFLGNIIFWTLRTMLFITVISKLGVETSSFVAILGAAGLAVGLSLQGSLSNFAGGILIILFKPFRVGDTIEVQGEQGSVAEILIFSTKMITSNNQVVYIPNGMLSNGKIKNHSQLSTRRVDIDIITNYKSDVTDIKNKIAAIINQHPLILKEPKTDVFINNFTETSIHFSARVWTENAHHMQVKSDILEQCKDLVRI
ncbi:mechanosensitive ion channel [Flavobacterium sp. F372]|uniref:Mechanosensitive ion channel n=1 Tax=Flavobacterium bernardetii TaxID=2813823 RepID=A0ABR7IZP7_9FLAO|nr:mechanosensitive ion channel domain-containing protein [Flavobacterium bernardetii]MBC5835259.1 mechanosensitive ion channel [Flavobacterium bernardetii]NHF71352.1 mechanosensitive ion channel [Flavobacterium bernardetii]